MADEKLPLLVLPTPADFRKRDKLPQALPKLHFPSFLRQSARLEPQFKVLQDSLAFQVQHSAPTADPDLVVVLGIVGTVRDFALAVAKVPELVWLNEWESVNITADEEFYHDDGNQQLPGQFYLIGTNQQALQQLLSLWSRWQNKQPFAHGQSRWRYVFDQLKFVRFWDRQDRLTEEVLLYWNNLLIDGIDKQIRFEIEAWCYPDAQKNQQTFQEISTVLNQLGGAAIQNAVIPEIGYHGILATLPSGAVQAIVEGREERLVASNRVMFFRPRSQAVTRQFEGEPDAHTTGPVPVAEGDPIVALLDGMPMQNHPLLSNHLIVDDPDGLEAHYHPRERVHGTAMASLIVHDELEARSPPAPRKVYVRPVLMPDVNDNFNEVRVEQIPDNQLIIDLIHRAVKRIFEGDAGDAPAAPSVKIINLSLGDVSKPFGRQMSPWARLIDWLSWKYNVLFIISAGNHPEPIVCDHPGAKFGALTADQRIDLALKAITESASHRSIISPAESINSLTVGALHHDSSAPGALPADFYDLLPMNYISPVTRTGSGYRRAMKPDVLFPGGRQVYRRRIGANPPDKTILDVVNGIRAPGHKVAYPTPGAGSHTGYLRGTSNAAAIASRHAAELYEVIAQLKIEHGDKLPQRYDTALLKAMVAHGASWIDADGHLKQARPDLCADHHAEKRFLSRWLGYGPVAREYGLFCTPQRVTMVGVGDVKKGMAVDFEVPLPRSLAGKKVERRLTVTLAWLTPLNHSSQQYRCARLWFSPPKEDLNVNRQDAQWQSVRRGTLQHEILSGDDATAYTEGSALVFRVNCEQDARTLDCNVAFALVVSLEVAPGSNVPVYQEVADVIRPKTAIVPAA